MAKAEAIDVPISFTAHYEAPRWTVSLGYTLNVGNFQSLRVDIGLSESKLPDESRDEAFDRIAAAVAEKFIARIKEEKEALESEGLA